MSDSESVAVVAIPIVATLLVARSLATKSQLPLGELPLGPDPAEQADGELLPEETVLGIATAKVRTHREPKPGFMNADTWLLLYKQFRLQQWISFGFLLACLTIAVVLVVITIRGLQLGSGDISQNITYLSGSAIQTAVAVGAWRLDTVYNKRLDDWTKRKP